MPKQLTQEIIKQDFVDFALTHMSMQKITLLDSRPDGQEIIGIAKTEEAFLDSSKDSFTDEHRACLNSILTPWMAERLAALGFDAQQDVFIDPDYMSIYESFMVRDWISPEEKVYIESLFTGNGQNTMTAIENFFIKPLLNGYNIKARKIYYLIPMGSTDTTIYTSVVNLEN